MRTSTPRVSCPPTRSNVLSSSARSSFPCTATSKSCSSSRNSVPPWACSRRPIFVVFASVKAPGSWPNRSLSNSSGATFAHETSTNGPDARALRSWRKRAMRFLPVPVSPSTSTLAWLRAARSAIRSTSPNTASVVSNPVISGAPRSARRARAPHRGARPHVDRAGNGDARRVPPQPLEPVEGPFLFEEHVDDHVDEIEEDPVADPLPLDMLRRAVVAGHALLDRVGDGADLAGRRPVANHEVVGEVTEAAEVKDHDVV